MIAALEIPVSWIDSVLTMIAPAIPPICLVLGPLAVWKGSESELDGLTVTGIWLILMGLIFGIAELFIYEVIRLV